MTLKNLLTFILTVFLAFGFISCSGVSPSENTETETNTQVQSTSNLTAVQVSRLAGLAKVWGFLKYYHPEVTKGTKDWDNILMDAITEVKAVQNTSGFNQVIEGLIAEAGNPDRINPGTIPTRFAWMQDESLFNRGVREKLSTIQATSRPSSQYYVDIARSAGQTTYIREEKYSQPVYPYENVRMLALFRYWNIIEYFFPYKADMDREWPDVLVEFIPRMAAAENETQYHMAIKELTVQINDSHAFTESDVMSAFFGEYYAPFNVRYIENQTVITEVLNRSIDMQVGDIVLRCHGMAIDEFRNRMRKYTNGSNEPTIQRNMNGFVIRGQNDRFDYTISRNGETRDITVPGRRLSSSAGYSRPTYALMGIDVKWTILEGTDIGYINTDLFYKNDIKEGMAGLKDTRAIIFDIRNYPQSIVYDIAPYLNPVKSAFVKFTKPILEQPGAFYWTENYYCSKGDNPDYYKGKVVILGDEYTQSGAEFTVMALQTAPDSMFIGSQTAGADGDVSHVWLPGGIKTYFTGIGVYYPDGRPTQRIGIVPDIEVKPTIEGIREGRDDVLERAVEFIETNR